MWYKDYKKQSYRINWQAVDAQGLKAAWLIDAPISKFYDKCGDMVLKSPHPYIPYCNHFSCMDSLYGVSAPVCQSSIYYINNNMSRILETTSGNNGYNREVELLSNFTESYSMFARFYYHPSFYATGGTGILTAFSSGSNDMPASIFVDASGFKFTADNGLHYASGTINLPEGWYDVWGIFDSGAAVNTRLIVNGEEQHGTYTPAPIRPTNRDFVVAGDKGTGNNYWGTFSEIRFYNWPVPLGMAQYVYEPNNINSLYSLPEDDVFSSIVETNTSLFLPSRSGINNNWKLFIKAPEGINQGSPLYVSGPIPWSGGISLYIHHDRYNTNSVNLSNFGANIRIPLSYDTGVSGQCIVFKGTNWLASSGNPSYDLDMTGDRTITGWFNLGSIDNIYNGYDVYYSGSPNRRTQTIITNFHGAGTLFGNIRIRVSKDSVNNKGYVGLDLHELTNSGPPFFIGGRQYTSRETLLAHPNLWTYFAYRYDSATNNHYFNVYNASGNYTVTITGVPLVTAGNANTYVGAERTNATNNSFINLLSNNTKIDQLHIWNRVLSDVEIDSVRTNYF